ncbi:MAG: PEP-CTERM sorting domain-containing protein [Gammaproteobacteria bacterium]|jgi:hypothetical protein
MKRTLVTTLLSALPFTASAIPVEAPEPGILPLLSAGGVVLLAVAILRRRK